MEAPRNESKFSSISDNTLKISSASQDTVTGQRVRSYSCESSCDKAGIEVERREVQPPIPDGSLIEFNSASNLLCTDDKNMHIHTCAVLPDRNAVWHLKGTGVSLSALAATVLVSEGLIKTGALEM